MTASAVRTLARLSVAATIVVGGSAPARGAVVRLWTPGPAYGAIESLVPEGWCDGACTVTVESGETVTLVAHAAAGARFQGWAGDCSGRAATCTLRVAGGALAVAAFAPAGDGAAPGPVRASRRLLRESPDGGTAPGGRTAEGDTAAAAVATAAADTGGYAVLRAFAGTPASRTLTVLGGRLYGTSADTIFTVDADGSGYTVVHTFACDDDGGSPGGPLAALGGTLYGTTESCGPVPAVLYDDGNGLGTVYRINSDGTSFARLHAFAGGSDGAYGNGALAELDGTLYGTTSGGEDNAGTIFAVGPDGSGYAVLRTYPWGRDGAGCANPLTAVGGALYGTTTSSGAGTSGTVFRMNPDGTGYTVLHTLVPATDGAFPTGSLVESDGALYGTASAGGPGGRGTLFRVNLDGTGFTVLHAFAGGPADGSEPAGVTLAAPNLLYGTTFLGGASDAGEGSAGTIFAVGTDGSGFEILHSFGVTPLDGVWPSGPPVVLDGALLGVTTAGGSEGRGVLYRLGVPRERRVRRHLDQATPSSAPATPDR